MSDFVNLCENLWLQMSNVLWDKLLLILCDMDIESKFSLNMCLHVWISVVLSLKTSVRVTACLCIRVTLNFDQRRFFLQKAVVSIKSYNWPMHWEKVTILTLKWNVYVVSSKIQETLGKGGRKSARAGGWEESWETGLSGHGVSISIINTQQLCLSAQNLCVQVHEST